jgi:polar amino acid transport system permease protein
MTGPDLQLQTQSDWRSAWQEFPYWLVAIVGFLVLVATLIFVNPEYRQAFDFIVPGVALTLRITFFGFAIAIVIGLLAGLGRVSRNVVIRNVAITYIEFIRGVPTLVLILTVSFTIVPLASNVFGFSNSSVPPEARGIISLSIIYGAFMAEIFRAGIESIPPGQMEAARSLGMTYTQAMWRIILPQAIRNVSPALGNDFIAMLKDSSLLSVLAIRELTQRSRLYAGSTFRFDEAYLVLTFLYLSMTIALSLLLRWYERRLGKDGR